MNTLYPVEIKNISAFKQLKIDWSDKTVTEYSHYELRQSCKCANCTAHRLKTGHSPEISEDVAITDIAPMGEYGVQFKFSDGHGRGIYPWEYLKTLMHVN